MIVGITSWLLSIYYIPPSSISVPVKPIQHLRLPPLREPDIWTRQVYCNSAPNPTRSGLFPKYIPPSIPFINQPEMAMISLEWNFYRREFGFDGFSMFVHKRSIKRTLSSPDDWPTKTPVHTIDWDDWGPSVTFLVGTQEFRNCFAAKNGQRCASILPQELSPWGSPYPMSLVVQDLNPYHVRRASYIRHAAEEMGHWRT